jgi:hypothetical protein
VFRKQLDDLRPALLDQLRVVRAQHTVVTGQQALNLVEEDDGWAVVACAGEDFRQLLDGCPDLSAEKCRPRSADRSSVGIGWRSVARSGSCPFRAIPPEAPRSILPFP